MSSPLGGLPQLPMQAQGQAGVQRFTIPWAGWFSIVQNILTASSSSGASTARPTTNQYIGMPYFDTTLGKPVWLKTPGSSPVWVDATGTPA